MKRGKKDEPCKMCAQMTKCEKIWKKRADEVRGSKDENVHKHPRVSKYDASYPPQGVGAINTAIHASVPTFSAAKHAA